MEKILDLLQHASEGLSGVDKGDGALLVLAKITKSSRKLWEFLSLEEWGCNAAWIMKVSSLASWAAKAYNLINKFIKLHLKTDWAACPVTAERHPELGMARTFVLQPEVIHRQLMLICSCVSVVL